MNTTETGLNTQFTFTLGGSSCHCGGAEPECLSDANSYASWHTALTLAGLVEGGWGSLTKDGPSSPRLRVDSGVNVTVLVEKVWENSKQLFKHLPSAHVSTVFLVHPNSTHVNNNSTETQNEFSIVCFFNRLVHFSLPFIPSSKLQAEKVLLKLTIPVMFGSAIGDLLPWKSGIT